MTCYNVLIGALPYKTTGYEDQFEILKAKRPENIHIEIKDEEIRLGFESFLNYDPKERLYDFRFLKYLIENFNYY